ncbi:MAG: O-antigen translocase [Victivallaceae bacterium]
MEKCRSSRQILKSSSIIGSATILKVLIGMVRTKFAAVLIGPAGMGILGICNGLDGLLSTLSGFGLNCSGVKVIAEKSSGNDPEQLAKIVASYRMAIGITSVLGLTLMVLFCYPLSRISFANGSYAWMVALLGVAVALNVLSAGQQGLLQGMRQIGQLAKINIGIAIGSTLVAIPCYYLLGINGIAISLVLGALIGVLISHHYVRKLAIRKIKLTANEFRRDIWEMLRLGVSFSVAGVFSLLANYLILILISREVNMESSGLYQSAFGLSGMLINFVLSAMGTDYFPRLAEVSKNKAGMSKIVREQTRVSLLLVLPGLLGMLIFAPLLIRIFFSASFSPAILLLQLFMFGGLLRCMSWPLGFVFLATGEGKWYMMSEIIPSLIYVLAVYFGVRLWGVPGAVIGYGVMCAFYLVFVSLTVYWRTGLSFGRTELGGVLAGLAVLGLAFGIRFLDYPEVMLWSLRLLILISTGIGCLMLLMKQTGLDFVTLREHGRKIIGIARN